MYFMGGSICFRNWIFSVYFTRWENNKVVREVEKKEKKVLSALFGYQNKVLWGNVLVFKLKMYAIGFKGTLNTQSLNIISTFSLAEKCYLVNRNNQLEKASDLMCGF